MDTSLSIIIVNYRSWYHLRNCIQSLLSGPNLFEIIVVDNHSGDGQFDTFKAAFPNVLFLESKANLGFGAGCHMGVKEATKEYLLFLNPDTIATPGSILAMLNFISTNKEFGIVSCRQHENLKKHFLLLPNLLRLSGIWRSFENALIKRKYFRIKQIKEFHYIEPEWVSASVLMISKNRYVEAGGWNKKLWMYFEDPDLCRRVGKLGLKIALLIDYFIRHEHGGATRLNKSTSIITKGEVLISKHVYIQENFNGVERTAAQVLAVIDFISIGTIKALVGLIFFFIPVLNIHTHIWKNSIGYYANAIKTKSWLSPKLIRE